MNLRPAFNGAADALVRPRLGLARRSVSAFQVCGYTGLVLAVALAMALVVRMGLSPLVMAAVVVSAMATFLLVALATKILTGAEELVYYHHEIAVMVVAALLLRLLGQPVLPYLDATLLGVGVFLACGRVGCLMVGCCHGRPHTWGVRYRPEHAEAGFPGYYVGVRLFPIQALESITVLVIVAVGTGLVLAGGSPGSALAWYVISYDLVRFFFEFVRGDPERPYLCGFSEAQWTSLVLMIVVAGLEFAGHLPFQAWHVVATAAVAVVIVGVWAFSSAASLPRSRLLLPRHVREIAVALQSLRSASTREGVALTSTSQGIRISASAVPGSAPSRRYYALSCRQGALNERAAQTLAEVILQLEHRRSVARLLAGRSDVYHLLVHYVEG